MSARARGEATRVIPDELGCEWVHREEDVERTMHETSGDYHAFYGWPHGQFSTWVARANPNGLEESRIEASMSSSVEPATLDKLLAVRRFLEDTGVIKHDEDPMTLSEMRANFGGSMMR